MTVSEVFSSCMNILYGATVVHLYGKHGEDGKTKFAAAGTFRNIVNTYPNWPLVSWSYSVEDGQAYIELVGRG